RPDVPDDLEAAGDVIQHLADIFADLAHRAAAGGAGAIRGVDDLPARQVLGQWAPTGRLLSRDALAFIICRRGAGFDRHWSAGGFRLQFIEHQFQLLDDALDLLRGAAELLTAQARDLDLQFLDLECFGDQTGFRHFELGPRAARAARSSITIRRNVWTSSGRGSASIGMSGIVATAVAEISFYNRPESISRTHPATSGRQVRIGIRQSIPSSNMPSC